MKEQKCRSCNHSLDANTAIVDEAAKPKKGDLSVCAYCGALSEFTEELDLMPLTHEALVELNDTDPDTFDMLLKVQRTVQANTIHP